MLCQQRMSLSRAIKSKIDNLSGVQIEIGDVGEEQHVRTDGMIIVLDKAMLEYMVSLCDVNVLESKSENLLSEVEENCTAYIVVKIVRAAACLILMLTDSPEHELLTTKADGRLSVPAKNVGGANFHSFGNAVEADLFGGIFVLGGWQNKSQSGELICFTDEAFLQESWTTTALVTTKRSARSSIL